MHTYILLFNLTFRVGLRCQSTLHQLEPKVQPSDESYLDHETDVKSKNKKEVSNKDLVRNSLSSFFTMHSKRPELARNQAYHS